MKKLAVILSTLLIGNFALAAISSNLLIGKLTRWQIDPNWTSIDSDHISSADVMVDLQKEKISLTIYKRFRCPPGRVCPMVMPAPLTITLPLVKVEKGHCDTYTYTAKQDKRPVDGIFEQLVVHDNRNFYRHCRSVRAIDGTIVEYTTKSWNRIDRGETETNSTFYGDYLQELVSAQ